MELPCVCEKSGFVFLAAVEGAISKICSDQDQKGEGSFTDSHSLLCTLAIYTKLLQLEWPSSGRLVEILFLHSITLEAMRSSLLLLLFWD